MIRNDTATPNPFVPVIMVSANRALRHVCIARDAGMTEYLAKPFSAKAMYARIRSVIENHRAFIRTVSYFGPNRRRRRVAYAGLERRRNSIPDGHDRRQRSAEIVWPERRQSAPGFVPEERRRTPREAPEPVRGETRRPVERVWPERRGVFPGFQTTPADQAEQNWRRPTVIEGRTASANTQEKLWPRPMRIV